MNKYKKAFEELKLNAEDNVDYMQNISLIEELVKKSIAIKPDVEGDGYADGQLVYDTWICPSCEEQYEVGYDYYKYCPNCGQKLDLSEVEDDSERNV